MSNVVKYGIIGGFVVVLGIAWAVAYQLEGKEVGEPCEANRGLCRGEGAECLFPKAGAGYCSVTCSTAKDCPKGWACTKVSVDTYSGKTGQKTKTGATQMCQRP